MAGPFELQLTAFAARAGDNANAAVRKIALDVLSRIVLRSPVGNPELWKSKPPPGYVGGLFRGNWQVSMDAPPDGTLTVIDAGGGTTIAAGAAAVPPVVAARSIFVMNNLPYAWPLEAGGSTQAPAGMVGLTVAEFQAIVGQAASEVKADNLKGAGE